MVGRDISACLRNGWSMNRGFKETHFGEHSCLGHIIWTHCLGMSTRLLIPVWPAIDVAFGMLWPGTGMQSKGFRSQIALWSAPSGTGSSENAVVCQCEPPAV